jgi:hypothetical protein
MANRTAGEVDQLARPVAGNTAAAGSAVVKLIEKKD